MLRFIDRYVAINLANNQIDKKIDANDIARIPGVNVCPAADQKQPCVFCLNARSDPKHELSDDNDYSAIYIGSMQKDIIAHLISGDRLPVRIEIMQWNEKHQQNEPIFRYAPKFCPECGRDLRNDYKDSGGG